MWYKFNASLCSKGFVAALKFLSLVDGLSAGVLDCGFNLSTGVKPLSAGSARVFNDILFVRTT